METGIGEGFVGEAIVFLLAALVSVPIFRRLGLGSILGYLSAGAVIGPFGLRLIDDVEDVFHIAELGVVLLLFVIGLELKPSRLWTMRRDIFGLGLAQVVVTGAALTAAAHYLAGLAVTTAAVAGFGLALSSTAFALQLLRERGDLTSQYGHRAFAILLLQDMSIVPLLAAIPLLASPEAVTAPISLEAFALIAAVVAAVVMTGRFALNPLFRLLAETGAQEIMTAAALLVVIGAASAMAAVGLSMALGAFLAGVLLAESSYRHQLEADLEPFRGLLLGLFFIAVGMSVDWPLVARNWLTILIVVPSFMAIKSVLLFVLARIFGAARADARRIALVLPQGGEFAFVLFAAAIAAGLIRNETANLLIAAVTLSMALTPALAAVHDLVIARMTRGRAPTEEMVETFDGNDRRAILVGFGRFGQIVAGLMHEGGCGLTAIDNDPTRIRAAAAFGYKVYFGDGTRVSVLRAAGADEAKLIALCMNSRAAMTKAIEQIRREFPQAAIYCRAGDRTHAIELTEADVDFQVRETLESAILLGRHALLALGFEEDEAREYEREFRQRDRERLMMQRSLGLHASIELHAPAIGERRRDPSPGATRDGAED